MKLVLNGLFFPIVLICALLPDIDSPDSYFGRSKIWRPLQFIVKHRGVFHSFTFCVLVAILFAFVLPIVALPFFLGYGSHLLADSFTQEGINPFWPWKKTSQGPLRTGGSVENGIFIGFIIMDCLLVLRLFV